MVSYDRKQKATIVVAIVTAFITTFTGSALNLSIPAIGDDFGVSAKTVGWLITGYMLTVATLSVPMGKISDLTNRRRILILGISIFGLASVLAAFSWTMWILMVARILQGIGGSFIFGTSTAVLISKFSGNERGKILGYSLTSTYVGLTAGPVLGGILNHNLGWRSVFFFTIAICLVAFFAAVKDLDHHNGEAEIEEDSRGSLSERFDAAGNILFVFALFSFMFGLSTFSTWKPMLVLIPMGIVLGVFFIRHELKLENPVIKVKLFKKNISYTLSNLAAFLNYGATFAIGYLMSIYLQVVMGYTSQTAGFILILQPGIMAVLTTPAGRMSDKISPFKIATVGMFITACGLVMFAFLSQTTPLWFVISALAVSGIGFALFSSPNTNAIMSCVGKEDYGVTSSILATMRSMGHTVSMAIITLVVGMFMGSLSLTSASPELLIHTIRTLFTVFVCLCVTGIFCSMKRKTTNSPK